MNYICCGLLPSVDTREADARYVDERSRFVDVRTLIVAQIAGGEEG